jgi:hypothetical protein
MTSLDTAMAGRTSRDDERHHVTRKEFCRSPKGAVLVTPSEAGNP